jgi:Holliday junction DNA helicase RuvA
MIAFILRNNCFIWSRLDIIVDHDGMGWQIAYPHTDHIHLNEEIKVYTYMHFTENETSLFGFESQEEKELFLRLISVKGLGPKTAMNMLASAGYDACHQCN